MSIRRARVTAGVGIPVGGRVEVVEEEEVVKEGRSSGRNRRCRDRSESRSSRSSRSENGSSKY
jgi:hypothetical protein